MYLNINMDLEDRDILLSITDIILDIENMDRLTDVVRDYRRVQNTTMSRHTSTKNYSYRYRLLVNTNSYTLEYVVTDLKRNSVIIKKEIIFTLEEWLYYLNNINDLLPVIKEIGVYIQKHGNSKDEG